MQRRGRIVRGIRSPSHGSDQSDSSFDGQWIRIQPAAITPGGARVYLGVDALANRRNGVQGFQWIDVVDAASFEHLSRFRLHRLAWSISLSKDGTRVYAIDMKSATLSILDAATGAELKTIGGLGTTPIFTLVR